MISTLDPERITYHSSDESLLDPQGNGRICLGRGVAEASGGSTFNKNDHQILGLGVAEVSGGSDFSNTTLNSWDEVSRRLPAGQNFHKQHLFEETYIRRYILEKWKTTKTTLRCRPETRDVSRIGDPRPGTYHTSALTRETPDPDVSRITRRGRSPRTP